MSEPVEIPYVGLSPYLEEHEQYFFGREEDREVVRANLMAARLTLLYGASGVGKSSLLNAGVLCRLRLEAAEAAKRRGKPGFAVIAFRDWRDAPLVRLKDEIRKALRESGASAYTSSRASLSELLRTLTEAVGGTALVILDQFEEYFLYHPRDEGEGAFASEFPQAIGPDVRANFLIAIREDALARLDRFQGSIPGLFKNYLRIEHLDRDAARQAIEEPVRIYNERYGTSIQIDTDLTEKVLDQVRAGRVQLGDAGLGSIRSNGEPDGGIETPFLQLVMSRLWAEDSSTSTLRVATLDHLGGAENIVRGHLDQAMATLSPDDQDAAAEAFHYLVTPSRSKIAHTIRDLAEYTEVPETRLEPVLEQLYKQRILRTIAPPLDQPAVACYEIFHDILAKAVVEWRMRHVQEQERLKAELRAEQEAQEAERLRREAEILEAARKRAEEQACVSFARELAAAAVGNLEIDPERSILLARSAIATTNPFYGVTPEAHEALYRAVQTSRLRTIIRPKSSALYSLAYLPDDKRILTGNDDGTISLCDAETGDVLKTVEGHDNRVDALAVSKDGKRAASVGANGTVHVWDTGSLTKITTKAPVGAAPEIAEIAMSPDGKVVAIPDQEGIRLYWIEDWHGFALREGSTSTFAVAFSPTGEVVAGIDLEGRLSLWDTHSGLKRRMLSPPLKEVVAIRFSRNGKRVATGSMDRSARVWDVASGTAVRTIFGHSNSVLGLDFDPTGERLVTAGADGSVRVWDLASGRELFALFGHTNPVRTAVYSNDGSRIASASWDGVGRIWYASSHTDALMAVAFSPDGKLLASAGRDGSARVWDVTSGRELLLFPDHPEEVNSVDFDPASQCLATASGNTVKIWRLAGGKPLVVQCPGDRVNSAMFSPDGTKIATAHGYKENTAAIWDAATGGLIRTLAGHHNGINWIAFSPDSRRLATASADWWTAVWEVASAKILFSVRHEGIVASAAFSPDGRRLATSSLDRTACVWDATEGVSGSESRPQLTLRGHVNGVNSVVFNRDGTRLATASWDRTVRLWDAQDGKQCLKITHAGEAHCAAFSRNGRLLAAAGETKIPCVYPVELSDLWRLATKRVTRELTAEERREYLHE